MCLLVFAAPAAFATVSVTSPASSASVTSPVRYRATASSGACAQGVGSMGIYINNQLTYVVDSSSLDTSLSLSPGSYNTVVEEWDRCGGASYTSVPITVQQPLGVTVTAPQDGGTYTSPVTYAASGHTTCAGGISAIGIYVNGQLAYKANAASLNTALTLSPGFYKTTVEEWDNCGGAAITPVGINVVNKTGVYVATPAAGSSVTSPVIYSASATTTSCSGGVSSMGVYVNNKLTYVSNGSALNTKITLTNGAQHTVVEEWDKCGGASYTTVNLNVTAQKSIRGIAVSPAPVSLPMSSTEQLKATATYSDGSTADVTSSAAWTIANGAVGTVSSSGLADASSAGATTITAKKDGVIGNAQFNVAVPPTSAVDIATWHADSSRTGWNQKEIAIGASNVSPANFRRMFSYLVDGYAYGEPLLMSNITIKGGVHNVLYVATEHDSVYAFDADNYGAPLWQVSLLKAGETPATAGTIQPFEGVTSTPAIDRASNTLYAVSKQKAADGTISFRLNALDITTGAQKFGGPVTINASVPGTNSDAVNGVVSLSHSCVQRAALLVANNSVYIGFGGCHSGWLLGYNAQTLAQTGVFNASPNLDGEGAFASAGGVWMGSGGPAADSAGNIYVVTGNGPWDGKTAFADSVIKFSPTLKLEDYFTPADYAFMNCNDADLAAGGIMLIPGTSLAVAGGKTGRLYVVNTSNLGKESAGDAGAAQTLWFEGDVSAPYSSTCTDVSGAHTASHSSYEIFGTPAWFNGAAYLGITPTVAGIPSGVRQFPMSGNRLTWGPYTTPGVQVNTRGTTPFLSANGSSGGVLWMIDTGQPLQNSGSTAPTNATLRAYDASNLSRELYDSNLNFGDRPGYGIKFTSPVVGNGKVYVSTGHDLTTVANPQGEIDVYGLN
ncbi:MAG TPA: Ig-like domain-containing protein [Terracidiphilus sp.]